MSNIDTNNCKFKDKFYGTCEATRDKDGECELACFDCKDCYYRQLQQLKYDVECAELRNKYDKEQFDNKLQRLKAENEGLQSLNDFNVQKIETLEAENEELIDSLGLANKYVNKYKTVLDEIEGIAKNGVKDDCGMPLDELSIILQLIKQAKVN